MSFYYEVNFGTELVNVTPCDELNDLFAGQGPERHRPFVPCTDKDSGHVIALHAPNITYIRKVEVV